MSKAAELHSASAPDRQASTDGVDDKLQERIRQRAYELYEARGAEPGHELEDWTMAESEILRQERFNIRRVA
jgi:Protein of unknown function (DUF2934)